RMNKQTFYSLLSGVWTKLFGAELKYIEPQPHQQECILECFVEIPIVGQNNFLMVLAMPTKLSYRAASLLFQLPEEELSKNDANDALCELGNILAGQVQLEISEDTHLDVPIQLTKEQAQTLMQDIEPDWEVFTQDEDGTTIYAGVFIGQS
ncbi:chemotaxis protein CheX, partial [Oleiphilus sp. HI0132]